MRISRIMPALGVLLFSLFSVAAVSAQDMECQEELSQANALYTTGRFDEAIERVDACLVKEGVSDAERRTAYRLKGLSFIGKGVEIDAKASVQRLLELIPDYQPDPVQDPPDFVAMVDEVKQEISSELTTQEEETAPEEQVVDENPVTQTPPSPVEEPVAEVAQKKKKGAGRFLLIGAGVAAAGVGAALLFGGDDGGGGGGEEPPPPVLIADPPPLP